MKRPWLWPCAVFLLVLIADSSLRAETREDAATFYAHMDVAERHIQENEYAQAISQLNEALEWAGYDEQRSYVYRKLSRVYREKEDLDQELKYVRRVQKVSPHTDIVEGYRKREYEILLSQNKSPGKKSLTGSDWIKMSRGEQSETIRDALRLFQGLDILLPLSEDEYVDLMDSYISGHLELAQSDLGNIFADMVYQTEPGIREAMDRIPGTHTEL